MDALSAGRPVIVSNDSFAADLAKKYSLGEVFEPGDVQGVVDALKRVRPLQAEIIEAAMADLSNQALADQHLKLVNNFKASFELS